MSRWLSVGCVLLVTAVALDAEGARGRKRAGKGKGGAIAVTSSVTDARVIVDGKAVGKTPLRDVSVGVGVHTVVVKRPGFLDYTEKVQVAAGKTVVVSADLLPFAGVLKITADVQNAQVWVDGKNVGKAPLDYEVKLGHHEVKVTAPGRAPFVTKVTADPGNEYPIAAKLASVGFAGDDLALVPLGGGGVDDDLALVPLGGPAAGGGDVLELTALTPPGGELGLAALPGRAGTSGVGTTIEPVKPWYLQWWAWTAAAAVVVTAATVTAVMLSGGEDALRQQWDCEMSVLGDQSACYDVPRSAILQF